MNILISGVGGPTPLGIAKSIRNSNRFSGSRLIGVDGSRLAPGLYNRDLFDETYLIPHSGDKDYWTTIESLVQKEKIDFAFIVPETEVIQWSERSSRVDLPCRSLVPDGKIAALFYDKLATASILTPLGLAPRTLKIDSVERLSDIGDTLGYPFWVRGGVGAGAIGSFKVESGQDLTHWLKINPHVENFLASEYLQGRNYACKVLCYDGRMVKAASAERVGYLLANAAPSGISGMCAHGHLVNNDFLVEGAIKALNTIFDSMKLRPHGMFTIDFKEDRKGVPKITEINIRHVSFTHAFTLGGCNFVEDTLGLYAGDPVPASVQIHRFDREYTFIRGVDTNLFLIEDHQIKSRSL